MYCILIILWHSCTSCWSTVTFALCLMTCTKTGCSEGLMMMAYSAFCWESSLRLLSRKHLIFLRDLKMPAKNVRNSQRGQREV